MLPDNSSQPGCGGYDCGMVFKLSCEARSCRSAAPNVKQTLAESAPVVQRQ
jgi:hypothetical protein